MSVAGVDPLEVLDKVGVDMARLQLLDSAAPRQAINWEESGGSTHCLSLTEQRREFPSSLPSRSQRVEEVARSSCLGGVNLR